MLHTLGIFCLYMYTFYGYRSWGTHNVFGMHNILSHYLVCLNLLNAFQLRRVYANYYICKQNKIKYMMKIQINAIL